MFQQIIIVASSICVAMAFLAGCVVGEADPLKSQLIGKKVTLATPFTGMFHSYSYKDINSRLIEKVPENEDIHENLAAARQYYEEINKGMLKFLHSNTIDALKQFLGLEDVMNDLMCSESSFSCLTKNNIASGGLGYRAESELVPMTRVAKVIHNVWLAYARRCVPMYTEKYRRLHTELSLEPETLSHVETYMNMIIARQLQPRKLLFGTDKREIFDLLVQTRTLNEDFTYKITYDTLVEFAQDDPDRKYLAKALDEQDGKVKVHKKKIVALVNKYLVEPCDKYTRKLGTEVFIPLGHDINLLEARERAQRPEINQAWLTYKLCLRLQFKDLDGIIAGVAKIASKH